MAEFPVSFNDRLISYTAVGGETAHDFDFPVYDDGDITVIRIRSGTVTTLTITTHYTVTLNTDQEADPGGTVTLVTATTAADVHLIIGSTVIERTDDFAQRGPWPAPLVNKAFDRIIMMLQEMYRIGVAWDSHFTGTKGSIPYDIAANQFIRRNSGNTDWEAVTVATSGTTVVTANDTTEGIVELATDAEAAAVTDTGRALVPANFAGKAGQQVYEEGTFTPALTFGGGSTGMTFSAQAGTYTQIGRIIHFDINLVLTAKGSSTGTALVTGLPTNAAGTRPVTVAINNVTAGVGDTIVQAEVTGGATTITLRDMAAGSTAALTDVDFTNTTSIRMSGSYRI